MPRVVGFSWPLLLLLSATCNWNCGIAFESTCGTLLEPELERTDQAERTFFGGRRVRDMSRDDLSNFVQDVSQFFRSISGAIQMWKKRDDVANPFQLVGIPIVFHVLKNQNVGDPFGPNMTEAQGNFTTSQINKLFEIYDKKTKITVPFAKFVYNGTIEHETPSSSVDLLLIGEDDIATLIQNVDEWQFKFHVVVGESKIVSGQASFPTFWDPDAPMHNVCKIDYRALACYNYETGEYLCNNIDENGQPFSHTSWARVRSSIVAHEIGHLFGLIHTFRYGCRNPLGDMVPDTPQHDVGNVESCVGLLPYDKDRDFYDMSLRHQENGGANATTCGGSEDKVCGSTCAACCLGRSIFDRTCDADNLPRGVLTTEEQSDYPVCCTNFRDRKIEDTCRFQPGIDPKNNIMAYAPDYCMHEFTPGQLARMMALTREFKKWIYCNYANVLDEDYCTDDTPCATTATNPRCF